MTTLGPKYIPYNYMEPLGYVALGRAKADPCYSILTAEVADVKPLGAVTSDHTGLNPKP